MLPYYLHAKHRVAPSFNKMVKVKGYRSTTVSNLWIYHKSNNKIWMVIVINVNTDGNILGVLPLICTLMTINIVANMYILMTILPK